MTTVGQGAIGGGGADDAQRVRVSCLWRWEADGMFTAVIEEETC